MRFSNGIVLKDCYFITTFHPEEQANEIVFQCAFGTGLTTYTVDILKFIATPEYDPPEIELVLESLGTIEEKDYTKWCDEVALLVSDLT